MSAPVGDLIISPGTPRPAGVDRRMYRRLANRAKWLSWASLGYMTLEGAIAILAGVLAGSVALVGFGIDSAIEGFASAVIVWRFTGSRVFSEAAEGRAQKLVALQFFVLAPYVGFESIQALLEGERPDTSWLGIGLAASSVLVMPYLGIAKQRIAEQIGSAATKGEGRQNMLCAYLAGALLVGLLGNTLVGAWWLDPGVGLLIAGVAVKEGLEAWRGEGCACVAGPLAAIAEGDACEDECCSPMPELPIACTLTPDGMTARLALIDALAADGLLERSATASGLRVRLRDSPEIERRTRELVAAESKCCAFLDFQVRRDDGELLLDISGPEDARPVIDLFFAPGAGSELSQDGSRGG